MQGMKTDAEADYIPVPPATMQQPPEIPNTFSDGGLICPTSAHWQIGGLGVFWRVVETTLNGFMYASVAQEAALIDFRYVRLREQSGSGAECQSQAR